MVCEIGDKVMDRASCVHVAYVLIGLSHRTPTSLYTIFFLNILFKK